MITPLDIPNPNLFEGCDCGLGISSAYNYWYSGSNQLLLSSTIVKIHWNYSISTVACFLYKALEGKAWIFSKWCRKMVAKSLVFTYISVNKK